MSDRLSDRFAERAASTFVGRTRELARFASLLVGRTPIVAHVHGIGGIGKTTLVEAFAREARRRGAKVAALDCRGIEPTERGVLHALAEATGSASAGLRAVVARIRRRRGRFVLVFDGYEGLGLADTWIRRVLVPALPENARLVFAGRNPPSSAWSTTPGAASLFETVHLGPLGDAEASRLLEGEGIDKRHVARIQRFAAGHPLALKLAAWTVTRSPTFAAEGGSFAGVLQELVARFVGDVDDPDLRRALDACSVVRRSTRSVLAALLGGTEADRVQPALAALPFVETQREGLVLHDSVRVALSAALRASDPERHRVLRRAAWNQLRRESRAAGLADLWGYTADLLHLVESPIVREAFFPSRPSAFSVEPARAEHADAIRSIARRHDGEAAADVLERWRRSLPAAFHVARDADGSVAGFYCLFEPPRDRWAPSEEDPVVRAWLGHLRREPLQPGQRALFLRRWLAAESGDAMSAVQAACFLDIKRAYMELRPDLRRVYLAVRDAASWFPTLETLGFRPLGEAAGGLSSALLDMGPTSVDGWLTSLAARELGVDEAAPLDVAARAMRVEGCAVPLTTLEFGLLHFLVERPGEVVPREVLRREVWGHRGDRSSNVVDAVVRTLRRKLGKQAARIEAVRGVGYRYASWGDLRTAGGPVFRRSRGRSATAAQPVSRSGSSGSAVDASRSPG